MGTGKFANAKGKRGEREAVKVLQPSIDKIYGARGLDAPKMYRNQNQSADGGYDIQSDATSWLALEIKRCETLQITKWWRQCVSQGTPSQVPVLLYRQSRKQWKAVMFGYVEVGGGLRVKSRVQLDLESFLTYFEAKLAYMLDENGLNE